MIVIIAGSESDRDVVKRAVKILEGRAEFKVFYASAHREPGRVDEIVKNSEADVFICVAGLSAALPGVVAARTSKPVIGVPVSSKLGGLDALLSIAQMPKGVPVGCVGIDNGENAAHLALRILGGGKGGIVNEIV